MPPDIDDIADRSSGGSSPPSSSGASVSRPPIASTARAAIGSQSLDQTGRVASTHSERLQAGSGADPGGEAGDVFQPEVGDADSVDDLLPLDVEHAGIALGRHRLPGHVLGQVPVDRAALPGHQVGELPQGVRELLRVTERPAGPERATGPRRPAARVAGSAETAGRAEAEGRISHRRLPLRQDVKCHVRHVIRERRTLSKGEGEVRRRLSRADGPAAGPGRAAAGPAARGRGPVVAVTGAARGLGHALTVRLAASARIGRVVAIDDHRGDVTGVHWRVVDVRDPALAGRLTGVDVVVHTDLDLAPDSDYRARRAFNVRGAQTVLTAAAASRVGRVVLVTSAMVYGARPDNPVPLDEAAPLGADA